MEPLELSPDSSAQEVAAFTAATQQAITVATEVIAAKQYEIRLGSRRDNRLVRVVVTGRGLYVELSPDDITPRERLVVRVGDNPPVNVMANAYSTGGHQSEDDEFPEGQSLVFVLPDRIAAFMNLVKSLPPRPQRTWFGSRHLRT